MIWPMLYGPYDMAHVWSSTNQKLPNTRTAPPRARREASELYFEKYNSKNKIYKQTLT